MAEILTPSFIFDLRVMESDRWNLASRIPKKTPIKMNNKGANTAFLPKGSCCTPRLKITSFHIMERDEMIRAYLKVLFNDLNCSLKSGTPR